MTPVDRAVRDLRLVGDHDPTDCPAPATWGTAISHLLDDVGDQVRVAISISGTCPGCGRYDLARLIVNEDNRPEVSFAPRESEPTATGGSE